MAENRVFGREPIQVAQIDQDFCTLTYSVPPEPQSSLGNEGTTPQALLSSVGTVAAFRERDPVLSFRDSGVVESLYIETSKPTTVVRNSYELSNQDFEDFLGESVASGAFTIEMDMQFVPGGSGFAYLFSFGNGLGDRIDMYMTLFTTEGDTFATVTIRCVDESTNLGFVSGTYNLGPAGNFTDKTYHFAAVFINESGSVRTKIYADGTLIGNNAGQSNGEFTQKALMPGHLGAPFDTAAISRPIRISNVRFWSDERTQTEINDNKYIAVTGDPAGLYAQFIYDHGSIQPAQTGCNASLSTNLLTYSENTDLMDLADYSFYRDGGETVDGVFLQNLQVYDVSGIANLEHSPIEFLILEGKKSAFRLTFKKTAYSADFKIGMITEYTSGAVVTFGENSVTVDSQDGSFVSESESGAFLTEYTIEESGDFITLTVSAQNDETGVIDSSTFSPFFNITATQGDVIQVGEIQIATIEDIGVYSKTTDQQKQTTGSEKCFNTRSTCQDPDNYDKGVLPLKFIDKRSPIPSDDYYIPSLTSVRVTPAKLNPGGADRNARALGQRASIQLQFLDHPHNDRLVDNYRDERPYDPLERGTFWTKWRARNPYYMQRDIVLTTGYLKDGVIVDPITREFVITGFSGPDSNGRVTISGKDVLTLAEDEKAQAPVASGGRLDADITTGTTAITLEPVGIGDLEYPASGFARLGKEVVAFTRTDDDFTLTRSQFGTEAKAHDEGDAFQLCLRYGDGVTGVSAPDIAYDLLVNYANIPERFIDKDQWDEEYAKYSNRLYSAIITEPEGVSKLISEMCQQMYFTLWWDERLGKVIFKNVRLAQEDEVFQLNDDQNLIAGSVSWQDLSDELITQVWVYYGQIDPTDKLDQGSNYASIAITADPDAEGPDKHNLRRVKTVFARWIDSLNAGAAEDLGVAILNRYGNAPRQVTFRVDAKDDYLWLGDYIQLTNRLRVNRFGIEEPVNLQIFEAEESSLGSEYKFTAQEFIPALIGGDEVNNPNDRVLPITSDHLNIDLRAWHDARFGAPTGTETITFVIREGVTIGGYAAGGGVNVLYQQRNTANDIYDGGVSQTFGIQMGNFPILQRAGISSVTDTAGGASYDSGTADYLIREYPLSTALKTGDWPAGVTLKLIIEPGARILGEGGNGASQFVIDGATYVTSFGDIDGPASAKGGDGGHALEVSYDIEITNGGIIGGGGGGGAMSLIVGGAGDDGYAFFPGGGGAGYEISDIRENSFRTSSGGTTFINSPPYIVGNPAIGSQTSGGSGGRATSSSDFTQNLYIGGRGGNLATDGFDSSFFEFSNILFVNSSEATPGIGGTAGKAIVSGADMVTYVNRGDVRGDEAI